MEGKRAMASQDFSRFDSDYPNNRCSWISENQVLHHIYTPVDLFTDLSAVLLLYNACGSQQFLTLKMSADTLL